MGAGGRLFLSAVVNSNFQPDPPPVIEIMSGLEFSNVTSSSPLAEFSSSKPDWFEIAEPEPRRFAARSFPAQADIGTAVGGDNELRFVRGRAASQGDAGTSAVWAYWVRSRRPAPDCDEIAQVIKISPPAPDWRRVAAICRAFRPAPTFHRRWRR